MKYSLFPCFTVSLFIFSFNYFINGAVRLFKHQCFYIIGACKKIAITLQSSMHAAAAFGGWIIFIVIKKSYHENDGMIVLHCAGTCAGACYAEQPIAHRSRISSKNFNKQKGFFSAGTCNPGFEFSKFSGKKIFKKNILYDCRKSVS